MDQPEFDPDPHSARERRNGTHHFRPFLANACMRGGGGRHSHIGRQTDSDSDSKVTEKQAGCMEDGFLQRALHRALGLRALRALGARFDKVAGLSRVPLCSDATQFE